ncbi:MAG: ABC transporter permease [Candidatus Limnocylindria bacterium]
MTGTGSLIRLILRRDRIRVPIWIFAIVAIVFASASAVADLYSTPEQIASYATTLGTSPAAIALAGPPFGLDQIGGIVVYETGITAMIGIALMSIFLVNRHTRAEEEAGRTEVLRSTVVGRHAPMTATLLVVCGACLLVGVGVAAGAASIDVPIDGALLYGSAVAAFGIAFACIAAVAAQLMTNGRGVIGISLAVLGISYAVRAVGDLGDGTLSWLSPMGWSQQVSAFEDNLWWPLAISAGFSILMVAAAVALASRRDLGAGIVPPRPGPGRASWLLGSAAGLAFRLQRGSIIGWTIGVFAGGLAFGSFSREIQVMVEENPELASFFEGDGAASLTDAFFATALLVISLLGAAFAVSSALHTRGEETAGRVEPLLATGVSRTRLLLENLVVTLAGSVLVVAAGGAGIGLAYGLIADDLGSVGTMLGNALAYVPAALVLAGLAVLLLGWLPRFAAAAWAAVAIAFVVGWLGGLLRFPEWFENLSPFSHIPTVPIEAVTLGPIVALSAIALLLAAAGLVGFRRRDIGSA